MIPIQIPVHRNIYRGLWIFDNSRYRPPNSHKFFTMEKVERVLREVPGSIFEEWSKNKDTLTTTKKKTLFVPESLSANWGQYADLLDGKGWPLYNEIYFIGLAVKSHSYARRPGPGTERNHYEWDFYTVKNDPFNYLNLDIKDKDSGEEEIEGVVL